MLASSEIEAHTPPGNRKAGLRLVCKAPHHRSHHQNLLRRTTQPSCTEQSFSATFACSEDKLTPENTAYRDERFTCSHHIALLLRAWPKISDKAKIAFSFDITLQAGARAQERTVTPGLLGLLLRAADSGRSQVAALSKQVRHAPADLVSPDHTERDTPRRQGVHRHLSTIDAKLYYYLLHCIYFVGAKGHESISRHDMNEQNYD
jgi:hypothetical protein